jgi:cytochrome c peroxidase
MMKTIVFLVALLVAPLSVLATSENNKTGAPKLHGAGDDKTGYETKQYITNSKALTTRVGKKADLISFIRNPPLGLPAVPVPADNPATTEKIALGRKLFYDRRLSLNNTFSCAMCHVPEQGFSHNELAVAVGIEGRSGRRNSPTLFNVAFAKRLFHDGREDTLEQQIWGPLLARNEMGNPSPAVVLRKLHVLKDYQGLFEKVFNKPADMESLGKAFATYQRSLNSANSPFDQWYYEKKEGALSSSAKRGFQLFRGKASCIACHTVTNDHALFTDQLLHNTGHGYNVSVSKRPSKQKLMIAPGQFVDIDSNLFNSVSEQKPNDVGLYEITEDPKDRWKYKTPSLRNITLTSPYMHDGAFKTLKEVVVFYNHGGVQNEDLDPLIKPLNLSASEVSDLLAFLNSLTGSNVDKLIADGFAAPVGDTR